MKKIEKDKSWECSYCGHENNRKKRQCVKCKTTKKPYQMLNEARRKYYS